MAYNIFKNFFSINNSFSFSILYYLASFFIVTIYPSLTLAVLTYLVLFIMAESIQPGIQASNTPFMVGLMYFSAATLLSLLFFSVFPFFSQNVLNLTYPLGITILLAFIISGYEESIYRNLLVGVLGPLVATLFYTISHVFTGLYVLNFVGMQFYSYMIFTFLFGLVMYFLRRSFNMEVPKGVHFAFLLVNYGYATILGGMFL